MASTVRISQDAKTRLGRLQRSWHQVRGKPPTQQELLDAILVYLENHKEEFLKETAWRPLNVDEIQRLEQRLQVPTGDIHPYDIDEVVYGEDPE
jgi:hypothetical protein